MKIKPTIYSHWKALLPKILGSYTWHVSSSPHYLSILLHTCSIYQETIRNLTYRWFISVSRMLTKPTTAKKTPMRSIPTILNFTFPFTEGDGPLLRGGDPGGRLPKQRPRGGSTQRSTAGLSHGWFGFMDRIEGFGAPRAQGSSGGRGWHGGPMMAWCAMEAKRKGGWRGFFPR